MEDLYFKRTRKEIIDIGLDWVENNKIKEIMYLSLTPALKEKLDSIQEGNYHTWFYEFDKTLPIEVNLLRNSFIYRTFAHSQADTKLVKKFLYFGSMEYAQIYIDNIPRGRKETLFKWRVLEDLKLLVISNTTAPRIMEDIMTFDQPSNLLQTQIKAHFGLDTWDDTAKHLMIYAFILAFGRSSKKAIDKILSFFITAENNTFFSRIKRLVDVFTENDKFIGPRISDLDLDKLISQLLREIYQDKYDGMLSIVGVLNPKRMAEDLHNVLGDEILLWPPVYKRMGMLLEAEKI